jgi:TP901 family phage tail tape measure protein
MSKNKNPKVKIEVDAKELERVFKSLTGSLKKLDKSMKKVTESANKASTAMKNMGKKGEDAGVDVNKGAKKGSKGLSGMMINLLRTRAGFVVLGLIAKQTFDIIIGNALRSHREAKKLGGQVDRLAAEIRTITGERGSRLPLIGQLMELSNQFGQTYETMAKAKYDIVSGGFTDAADSAHLLEVASKSAVAGVSEVGTTAKVIVQSLRAYGESAEKATEFSDTLFKTIKLGITTMPELAGSIGRVTPIAKIAGLSFDELGASMAILTARGLKTTEAATSLRALLKALISPSSDTGEALADLGVTMDAGFTQAMIRLGEAGAEGDRVLAQIFNNTRAQMGVFSLAADNASLLIDAMAEFGEKEGSMQSAFDEVASSIGQVNKKQEQYIANFEKMKGLGAGAGAERSLEIVIKGLSGLSKEAYVYETVLSNLKSASEAYATVIAEQAKVQVNKQMALQILKTKELRSLMETYGSSLPEVVIDLMALEEAQAKLNIQLAEAGKEWDGLKKAQDASGDEKPLFDKAQLDGLIKQTERFNEEFLSGTEGIDEYGAKFKGFLEELKSDLDSGVLDSPMGGLSPEALKATWDAFVKQGHTLPTEELTKILAQKLTDAQKDATELAGKKLQGLGVDINQLIFSEGKLSIEGLSVEAIAGNIQAMIQEIGDSATDKIAFNWDKVLGLSKTGSWGDLFTYLKTAKEDIAAFDEEAKETEGMESLLKQVNKLRDSFNLLAGAKWTIGDAPDLSALEAQMRAFADTVEGFDAQAIDDIFAAMVQEGEGAEEVLRALVEVWRQLKGEIESSPIESDWAKSIERASEQAGEVIKDTLSTAFVDSIWEAENQGEAMHALFENMKKQVVKIGAEIVVSHIANRVKMLFADKAADAQSVMSAEGAMAAKVAINAKETASNVMSAISGFFKAHASVPFIGAALAGAAIAVMMSALSGGGDGGGGKAYKMAKGGVIPGFADGGMIVPRTGQAGLDSVPIMSMPGEGVIKRNTMQRLEAFLGSAESASAMSVESIGGGGQPMMVNFNVARPQSASDSVSMARTVGRMTREYNRRIL